MRHKDVVGIKVLHCRARDRYKNFYYDVKIDGTPNNALVLITGGKAVFDFGKTRFVAGKNDIVCHGYGSLKESVPVPGHPVSCLVLVFDILSGEGGKLTLRELGFPPLMRVKSPARIRSIIERLSGAFHSRDPLRASACSMAGLELLRSLAKDKRHHYSPETDTDRPLHSRIKEVLEYIRTNYKKRLAIADLAKRASMHPAYFSHLFKQETSVSPHQYVQNYKIERAKDFLSTFDEALVYTAEELGFHDYSHFYHAFKKVTGQSPRQFVRENREVYDPR